MRDGRATRRATVGRARCVSVDAYRERPDERGGSDCFGHQVVRDAREVITSMRVSRAR